MLAHIETILEQILGQSVRVHCHDILETCPFRVFNPQLQSLRDLPFINAVEKMAVMNQKTRTNASLRRQFSQHQIETEDLHAVDAFAPLRIDCDFECGAIGRRSNRQVPGLLVERRRQFFENNDGIIRNVVALTKICLKSLLQTGAFYVELNFCALDPLGNLQLLTKGFHFRLGSPSLFLKA